MLLGFFGVIVVVSVGLITWRGEQLRAPGRIDAPVSREGAFLANNVVFAAFAVVVLLGTTFPLIVEATGGGRLSVGEPYFDRMTMPLGMALLFLMAVAPVLPWRRASTELLRHRLFWPAVVGVVSAGDAGGADAVAVGDRRQSSDVGAEGPADRLGLGLAQLGELVGHVGDRAVLLAQLVADHRQPTGARGVALVGEDPGQRLGGAQVGVGLGDPGVVALDERHPAPGELDDRVVAGGLRQEAEGLRREVVVLLVEAVATGLGQREDPSRSAPPPAGLRLRLLRLDGALGGQVVEVPAYGGRGQAQPLGQVGGRAGTVLEDRPGHPLAGRRVLRVRCLGTLRGRDAEFHNTSVTLLPGAIQVRVA